MLTVEITEDLVLSEVALVTAVLRRLRELGIRVAIDDFGSGYSALSYLRDLPIDEIKLDRHFIASVTADARAAAVVRAVIDLTHDLGITVVAEGVEDAETASWLWEHGCDIGQGYHFCKPVDADQIPGLRRHRRPPIPIGHQALSTRSPMMRCARNASISLSDRPSRVSTSALCCPSVGAGRAVVLPRAWRNPEWPAREAMSTGDGVVELLVVTPRIELADLVHAVGGEQSLGRHARDDTARRRPRSVSGAGSTR